MEIKFNYQDIIDRCEQLSSFEARGKVDEAGQSRYLDIHIGEVDRMLIEQYIEQARYTLEEKFDRMITDSVDDKVDTRPVYEFSRTAGSSELFKYESSINSQYEDISESYEILFFPYDNNPTFAKVYAGYHGGMAFNNEKMLGANYLPSSKEKVYQDKSGVKYLRTDGQLYKYSFKPTFSWLIRTDTRWNGANAFTKHVSEAITSYVMAQWLSGRLDERVQFYESLFANSLTMATKNLFTKQAP